MTNKAEQSIYSLLKEAAESSPSLPAYDFLGYKRTFAEFMNDIGECAASLSAMGISKGDTISIYLPNIPMALVLFYAASMLGAISNLIHPQMPAASHAEILRKIEPKVVFILDSMKKKAGLLRNILPDTKIAVIRANEFMPFPLKQLYCLKELPSRLLHNNHIFTLSDNVRKPVDMVKANPRDTAVILLTGGTTGDSRGVCLSALNINSSALQTASYRLPGNVQDRMLAILPVFHGYGLVNSIHTALTQGHQVILLPYYKEKLFKKTILRTKPGYFCGIPRLYSRMADIFADSDEKLDFFKGLYCGGAKLSDQVLDKINKILKAKGSGVLVREGYGLTECVGACTIMPAGVRRPGSIGLPYEGVSISIRNPVDSRIMPADTDGEICVCSDTVMNGYLDGDNGNIQFHDGVRWLHTGDIGHMDKEGYVYFTGRLRRMIKVAGYEVFPDEIELLINDVRGVSNSCVIESMKDGLSYLKAYVVATGTNRHTENAIRHELHKKLPGWSVPGEFEFINCIPETLLKKNDYNALS